MFWLKLTRGEDKVEKWYRRKRCQRCYGTGIEEITTIVTEYSGDYSQTKVSKLKRICTKCLGQKYLLCTRKDYLFWAGYLLLVIVVFSITWFFYPKEPFPL